jgi:hypothetical protein
VEALTILSNIPRILAARDRSFNQRRKAGGTEFGDCVRSDQKFLQVFGHAEILSKQFARPPFFGGDAGLGAIHECFEHSLHRWDSN